MCEDCTGSYHAFKFRKKTPSNSANFMLAAGAKFKHLIPAIIRKLSFLKDLAELKALDIVINFDSNADQCNLILKLSFNAVLD
ncbi:hypothetical protein TNCT_640651 [Trichonephila clavata]|uniref:Uncharacterized protein n=1 Tax=Trichonephila clavata TaxID=2740835 RepID=A0A8X6GHX8_TRICU|nr:hypothetical protein TNCT_640651 [Trichonephila clavata]